MSGLLAVVDFLRHYMIAAMVAVFALTAASLYWPGRRATVEQPGRIPLEDES